MLVSHYSNVCCFFCKKKFLGFNKQDYLCSMIYLKAYSLLTFLWGFFSIYKVRQKGNMGKLISSQLKTFLTNFLLMPYCIYYAIKYKKI